MLRGFSKPSESSHGVPSMNPPIFPDDIDQLMAISTDYIPATQATATAATAEGQVVEGGGVGGLLDILEHLEDGLPGVEAALYEITLSAVLPAAADAVLGEWWGGGLN